MYVRFFELKEAIKATQALLDTSSLPVLSQDDWKVTQELIIVLKPFLRQLNHLVEKSIPQLH